MTHNDAAAELAELGKSDARILSGFARAACDAGHIDGDVAALVAEPKD